jgi:hypothetical protein
VCTQAIGPSTTVTGQGFDKALVVKTAYGSIEGARLKAHPGERLNVLGQGVPVLRTTSEAREDQGSRSGEATQVSQLGFHTPCLLCHPL